MLPTYQADQEYTVHRYLDGRTFLSLSSIEDIEEVDRIVSDPIVSRPNRLVSDPTVSDPIVSTPIVSTQHDNDDDITICTQEHPTYSYWVEKADGSIITITCFDRLPLELLLSIPALPIQSIPTLSIRSIPALPILSIKLAETSCDTAAAVNNTREAKGLENLARFYERTTPIVESLLRKIEVKPIVSASEYLMSHLAGLFLSREKIIDETVGDAVIGSVIGTLISTRNASREPSEYVEPGDYVTNRRFFSLFNDKNNDLQRILCAGSEGVLEGKEFADKLECFTFAIFETLRRFDTSRKEWSQVSTQKLRAAIDHLGILGSDDIANQDRHSELIVTQALNLDRLRKSLGPVDQSHVKDRLRYFGVETFFLARDMFFLGHVSKGCPGGLKKALKHIGRESLRQAFCLYAYYDHPAPTRQGIDGLKRSFQGMMTRKEVLWTQIGAMVLDAEYDRRYGLEFLNLILHRLFIPHQSG